MEKELKITDAGILYLSEELRGTLGQKISALDAPQAVLLIPREAEKEDVLNSLRVLREDINIRRRVNDGNK